MVNKKGEKVRYCISVQQGQYEDETTQFSAIIDGVRVNTDDGDELADRIRDAEKVTELTMTYGKKDGGS